MYRNDRDFWIYMTKCDNENVHSKRDYLSSTAVACFRLNFLGTCLIYNVQVLVSKPIHVIIPQPINIRVYICIIYNKWHCGIYPCKSWKGPEVLHSVYIYTAVGRKTTTTMTTKTEVVGIIYWGRLFSGTHGG